MPVLSVLDLAPVAEGSSAREALRNSVDLSRTVERLGFHRHWVAEHHNMPGIASAAPAVLIAHLADATSTIRVGAGGVMLPNHASLAVAEQFGMLEAMHPGRIDLGIGRAPGTDPLTARALRRTDLAFTEDEFPAQLVELLGYFSGRFPEGHPYRHVMAVTALGYSPALWLLGSSDYSAHVAGVLGLPFSFAHHFASGGTDAAVAAYRASFRPSRTSPSPTSCSASTSCARRRTSTRAGWPGRATWTSCGCAADGRVGSPHPRRPPRTSTARSSSRSPGRGPRRTSSAVPHGCANSCSRWPTARALTS
jgi:luciferase family oxidoreductase group 1